MKRIAITGANRGLGLEFTRQYLAAGERVFGLCRQPEHAKVLQDLRQQHPERLSIHPLDLHQPEQMLDLVQSLTIRGPSLDMLLNNAGLMPPAERFGQLDPETLLDCYQVNAVAPLMLSQALLPLLREGQRPRVVYLSSELGSIGTRERPEHFSYSASKAALNMLVKLSSLAMWEQGVLSLALSPGWVRTDMGGPNAELDVQPAVARMITLIAALRANDNGRFVDNRGKDLAW